MFNFDIIVTGNRFFKDTSNTMITINRLKTVDKLGFLVIGYRLKPVFKNHIFKFFKTVYLGDSWVEV